MKSFMKLFFASFLALIIFSIIALVIGVWIIGTALQPSKPDLGSKGVLVLDLSTTYNEQAKDNPLASLTGNASDMPPVSMILSECCITQKQIQP